MHEQCGVEAHHLGRLELRPKAVLRLYSIAMLVTSHFSLCRCDSCEPQPAEQDVITHARPLTIGTSDSHLPGAGPVDPTSLSTSHSGPGPLADTMARVLIGAGEMTRPGMSSPA